MHFLVIRISCRGSFGTVVCRCPLPLKPSSKVGQRSRSYYSFWKAFPTRYTHTKYNDNTSTRWMVLHAAWRTHTQSHTKNNLPSESSVLLAQRAIAQPTCFYMVRWEHSGSVVERLTRERGAAVSSLTCVTVLCLWARHIYPCLVLVQSRKTRPDITENFLTGT